MIFLSILLLILIPLLLSYLVFPAEEVAKNIPKKKTTPPVISKDKPLSFEEISDIFTHSQSTPDVLKEAIEQLIKHHGKIHAKLGDIPHPDYKRYLALIINLCKNPQADKDIIISLDQKLRVKNPRYGLEIDEAVNKGISARGF
ncbi:MAG: hypothetical protein COA44_13535 [Arcobacter sp.]|nr:MAG: hypothetical protein COA44_13535 [Arcobacter sp.]